MLGLQTPFGSLQAPVIYAGVHDYQSSRLANQAHSSQQKQDPGR